MYCQMPLSSYNYYWWYVCPKKVWFWFVLQQPTSFLMIIADLIFLLLNPNGTPLKHVGWTKNKNYRSILFLALLFAGSERTFYKNGTYLSKNKLKYDTHINPGPILNHTETKTKQKQILNFMKLVHLEVQNVRGKIKASKAFLKIIWEKNPWKNRNWASTRCLFKYSDEMG